MCFGVFIDNKLSFVFDSWVEANDRAKNTPGAMVRRVHGRARFETTTPVMWFDHVAGAVFSIAYHNERLVIHSVHGSEDGRLVIKDEMTDQEWFVRANELLQIARRIGHDQVVIIPCYPNRVKAQLDEPRIQIVGNWDEKTLLYKRRYGYAEAYQA